MINIDYFVPLGRSGPEYYIGYRGVRALRTCYLMCIFGRTSCDEDDILLAGGGWAVMEPVNLVDAIILGYT